MYMYIHVYVCIYGGHGEVADELAADQDDARRGEEQGPPGQGAPVLAAGGGVTNASGGK